MHTILRSPKRHQITVGREPPLSPKGELIMEKIVVMIKIIKCKFNTKRNPTPSPKGEGWGEVNSEMFNAQLEN